MKINPLNFFDRKIDSIPPHFVTTSLYTIDYQTETSIDKWIYENCFGRYCMIKSSEWAKDRMRPRITIGFENPADMTLFALSGLKK
mgnify:FL=1|tara:strand:- start:96 stop:353 length:258 start_codon:yes stop_codon:yes gene_type:complete